MIQSQRNFRQARARAGQTLAEYALIMAFISVVAISALLSMGGQVSSVYSTVNSQLNTAEIGGATAPAHGH
jgi:Flp pilus assembly pilin Flp